MSKVTNKQLAQTILNQLQAGQASQQVVDRLAAYIVYERRSKDAESITRIIAEMLQSQSGQVELDVTTVNDLSAEMILTIKKLFSSEGSSLILNHKKDSTLIGGVLVEAPGKRLDLTVRRRLQRLRTMGVN